ncbi:metal ABC transporter ATP-binding protein [Kitasatospora sp. NBC_01302]|uniref:metal ABC transporter ATP-binding protein n=1 Tax=Kitasatospora sp. NBC_01302 TaxID=2903575 RepID=UPI002E140C86|nr:metal ABC transporter ATP-binding protein [Kitasatospora sp. NBC_01302]
MNTPDETVRPDEAVRPDETVRTDDVIRLRGAHAALGGRPVLRGVDLRVAPGEVVALLGANGSGKSTTVKAVVGSVPLTGGERELFGTPGARFRAWHRIGYVPQRTTAAGGVPATVREVVATGRLARHGLLPLRRRDRAAVDRALDAVGLLDRAGDSVANLSGGQQQRVLIARALVGGPELLIMDEPMAGVDLASQRVLADTLRHEVAKGVAVLLVLHELGPLEPLIDRAVLLRDGRVWHDGPPATAPRPDGHHDHGHDRHEHAATPPTTHDLSQPGLLI